MNTEQTLPNEQDGMDDKSPSIARLGAWLPIETAPKDWGVECLLFDRKKGGVSIGSWWMPEAGGWLRTPGCARLKPTHWMPLPEAPNANVTGLAPAQEKTK